MIGVDLVVEDALTVREQVGRVSEITWSKVQGSGMTLARTQAYALRQLDAIAEKLETNADLGDIAKATKHAEPKVREWLAVLARTIKLQDGVSILELDRVLDSAPGDLESHRVGLTKARQNRVEILTRTTSRLLSQMNETVQRANSAVLLNPFDSPAAVRSSNQVAVSVLDFRVRMGIESGNESKDARRWGQAVVDARDRALTSAAGRVAAAGRVGAATLDTATEAFRSVDIDGDGIPDKPRAAAAAENASAAVKGAASSVTGTIGSIFRRKADAKESPQNSTLENESDES